MHPCLSEACSEPRWATSKTQALTFPNILSFTFQRGPGDPRELGGLPLWRLLPDAPTPTPCSLVCPQQLQQTPWPFEKSHLRHHTLHALQGGLGRQYGSLNRG